jgi:hypothetical protein
MKVEGDLPLELGPVQLELEGLRLDNMLLPAVNVHADRTGCPSLIVTPHGVGPHTCPGDGLAECR